MKTWKPSRRLVTTEQQRGFDDQRGRGRDRGAVDADARDQHDAEDEVEHEGAA